MKSQRLGLQPINNYKRVVNPRKKRFHMSSRMNSHGKIIITLKSATIIQYTIKGRFMSR